AAVPVFNLIILADIDKAKAQFYQAYYDYINKLQQAFQDVDDSLSERAANAKNLKKQSISLESTQRQEKIFFKKYSSGAFSKAQYTGITLN
ncbi:TolC family protein, partial [Francisella tularensis]|uniref:TolC family protein n=1 Tax=Francisella tularensis TaxID=263 RepID=UPI0023AC641E|nr:TolC family protein [Francisella tularensis subsp. holarctica]